MSKKINLTALAMLADSASASEIKNEFNIDVLPAGIKEALVELKAEESKTAARSAAKEIYALLEHVKNVKLCNVQSIRNARAEVAARKAALDEIAAAEVYAMETSNYLPLCKAIGMPVFNMGVSSELFSIVKQEAKAVTKAASSKAPVKK